MIVNEIIAAIACFAVMCGLPLFVQLLKRKRVQTEKHEDEDNSEGQWVCYEHEEKPLVAVAMIGTKHALGDMDCWCKPKVTVLEDERILISHNMRAHNWQPKPGHRSPVCICCGAIQNQSNSDALCNGPDAISTKIIEAEQKG